MLSRFFKDFKKYRHYIFFAAKSDLKSEVAGSYLNWLWWILDPLLMMLIYLFIMMIVFRKSILYTPIFVFIGLTLWDFFNKTLIKSSRIVKDNASVLKRVHVPKFVLILQNMSVCGFKMLISLGLSFAMIIVWAIGRFESTPLQFSWTMLWIIPVLAVLFLLVFGLCMIVMHMGVYVDDLRNVLQVGLRLLFYMCGVFYDLSSLSNIPAWAMTLLSKANPVAYLITAARDCLLYQQIYAPVVLLMWLVVSLLLCLLGIRLVYRNENTYIKVI